MTRHYCPTCGRQVAPIGKAANTPRHNNLTTNQPCRGAGTPTTTNPDPQPPATPRPAAKSTPRPPKTKPAATTRAARSAKKAGARTITIDEEGRKVIERGDDVELEGEAVRRAANAYPPEVRAKAVALMTLHGIASAHDVTGIPKGTLSRWARDANIDLAGPAVERTRNAALARRAALEEARVSTVAMLEAVVADAGHHVAMVARLNAEAAQAILEAPADAFERKIGLTGPYVVVTDTVAAEATDRAMALAGLPLSVRDAVGAVTRAIHDIQLLKGEATERGELVVEFAGIPRPVPSAIEVDVHEAEIVLGA